MIMSVKKNLFFNMMYQALNMCLPLITAPYLSRVIGVNGTGIFSYYYSVAGYFVLFGMLGLNNYGNRSIAIVRDDKKKMSRVFWEIYSVQIVSSIISLLAYILFAQEVNSEEKIVVWLNIFYVISAAFDINWFFFGLEQFKWTSIRNALVKSISVVLILIFVKTRNDLYIYIFIMSVSILISQLILWPKAISLLYWIRPEWSGIKRHIKPNLILFIPVVSVSLYKMMDKVMLGVISNRIQSGLYENAEKIINLPIVFVNALGTVMLPKMSNLVAKGEKKEGRRYIRDSMQFIMALAIAVSLGTAAIANNFAPVFFGEEFRECGKLIVCLAPITIFTSWANVIRTQYLIPNNKDKEYIYSVILGACVNLSINLMLIRHLGALGASIGTVFAEFSVMLSQSVFARRELDIKQYVKDTVIFWISGISMFIIVYVIGRYTGESIIGIVFQIIIGIVIYGGISLGLLYFVQKERLSYIWAKFFPLRLK